MEPLIKFGDWIVYEDGIINSIIEEQYISKDQLFDYDHYEQTGPVIWDWLIYVFEHSWVTKETVNDFNTAFAFAQDYFKDEKLTMINLDHVSMAQSLYIQKQLIDITNESNPTFERGIYKPNKESILYYIQRKNNIKFLPDNH